MSKLIVSLVLVTPMGKTNLKLLRPLGRLLYNRSHKLLCAVVNNTKRSHHEIVFNCRNSIKIQCKSIGINNWLWCFPPNSVSHKRKVTTSKAEEFSPLGSWLPNGRSVSCFFWTKCPAMRWYFWHVPHFKMLQIPKFSTRNNWNTRNTGWFHFHPGFREFAKNH